MGLLFGFASDSILLNSTNSETAMQSMGGGSFALWQCLCTFALRSIMLVVVSPFMGDIEAIVCGAAAHCEWEEYSDHSHIALYLLLLLLPSSPAYTPHWSKLLFHPGWLALRIVQLETCRYNYVQEFIETCSKKKVWRPPRNGAIYYIKQSVISRRNKHNLGEGAK